MNKKGMVEVRRNKMKVEMLSDTMLGGREEIIGLSEVKKILKRMT